MTTTKTTTAAAATTILLLLIIIIIMYRHQNVGFNGNVENNHYICWIQVLTAVTMNNMVFWVSAM
jgi:hypothetical protein